MRRVPRVVEIGRLKVQFILVIYLRAVVAGYLRYRQKDLLLLFFYKKLQNSEIDLFLQIIYLGHTPPPIREEDLNRTEHFRDWQISQGISERGVGWR